MIYLHVIVFGLIALVPEWRRTGLIICLAASANLVYADFIDGLAISGDYDAVVFHAMVDAIVAYTVLRWGSKGRFGQAAVLTLFMTWNLALLIDYLAPPYPLYEAYEPGMLALNIIQVMLVIGGIHAMVGGALEHLKRGIRAGHRRPVLDYRDTLEHLEELP